MEGGGGDDGGDVRDGERRAEAEDGGDAVVLGDPLAAEAEDLVEDLANDEEADGADEQPDGERGEEEERAAHRAVEEQADAERDVGGHHPDGGREQPAQRAEEREDVGGDGGGGGASPKNCAELRQDCARIARPELRARIARPKSRAPQIALKHIVGTWSEYESTQHFDVITAIESRIDTRLR